MLHFCGVGKATFLCSRSQCECRASHPTVPSGNQTGATVALQFCRYKYYCTSTILPSGIALQFQGLTDNNMKSTSQQKRGIHIPSQDVVTVKNYANQLTFHILHHKLQVATISMETCRTVGDLLNEVKQKLLVRFPQIVGLCSTSNKQVQDYALTISKYPLRNFKNNDTLNLLLGVEVVDPVRPCLADFKFIKCLGKGVSCSVYLVRHLSNGRLYAVKQIDKNYFNDIKRMEQVIRERKIMSEMLIGVDFVSKLYACFESQKCFNFVIEFYPGGEMFFHLQRHKFSEGQARIYFCEMILTFQKLHHNKIIYRDLKPENIMIDLQGHARLADFGLCKLNLEKEDLTYSYCGSLEYMAPETKNQNGYNYSVDFYTLGAFLYEMVVGIPPYYENRPLDFPHNVSHEFEELITRLIERDVRKRLTSFPEIKKSRWLAQIDWELLARKKYEVPIKLNPYESYIHDEFKTVDITEAHRYDEQKFDRLFEFFEFLSNEDRGISHCYKGRKNRQKEKRKSSNSCSHKNKSSLKNTSLSNSSKSDRKMLKAKSPRSPQLYTSPYEAIRFNRQIDNVKSPRRKKEKSGSKERKLESPRHKTSLQFGSGPLINKVKSAQSIFFKQVRHK